MADTKISALPAVAAPAAGDEFACNQAGTTRKETKAQITAATDAIHTAHVGAAVIDHPNNSVTDAKLRDSTARSVIGRAAAAGGDPADIVAGADDRLLARTGGTLAFQQATTGMLGNDIVTDPKLRNSAATSVIGRAGAGVGDPADIVAGVNDRVLSQAGGTLAFRQVSTAMVTNRTRKFFVPCVGGHNITDGTFLDDVYYTGWDMIDNKLCTGYGNFWVPQDYASGMTVKAIVIPQNNGNVYSQNFAFHGACGEAHTTHQDSVATAAVAITQLIQNCIQTITITNLTISDIVSLEYRRTGTDALDTINGIVRFLGWVVEYTADS